MSAAGRWVRRGWYLLNRRRLARDLEREIASHRAQMPAPGRFGDPVRYRELSADVWGWTWLDDLGHDVRYGARLLRRDRRFTLSAVIALALGLASTTTAFTFVNAAMLRSLPFENPEELVTLRTVDSRNRPLGVAYVDARDWRETSRTLSHVITSLEFPINLSEEGLPPARYSGSFISFDVFRMLGRQPIFGRDFRPEDDQEGAPRVAVIAYSVWQGRYGGASDVIGRPVVVNDVPATIVGVMPPDFHFPMITEVWVPLAQVWGNAGPIENRRGSRPVLVFAFGRLARGALLSDARAEMDSITADLAREYPATNEGISVAVDPIKNMYWGSSEGGARRTFLIIMGAVSFVLLIACVNVANLLLSRSVLRSREVAVRMSLGATRTRIVRQLIVESLLLAGIASGVSLLLSFWGVTAFSRLLDQAVPEGPAPFWWEYPLDWRVLAFSAAIGVLTVFLFGLAPAILSARASHDALKDGGRSASGGPGMQRVPGVLMTAQIALTLVLLTGAGLMLQSYLALYDASRVLDTQGIVTMRVSLGAVRYASPDQIKQFHRDLDERLASLPGPSGVTVASDIPFMTTIGGVRELTLDGRPLESGERPPSVAHLFVGPRYFDTLRLRLLRGRTFTDDDGAPGREAVIVNERFASMFFADASPIGERIRLANPAQPPSEQPWLTIVGVVPTVPQIILLNEPQPVVYVSTRSEPAPHRFVSIIARHGGGDLAALVSRIGEEVRKVDSNLPTFSVQTLDEILTVSGTYQRTFGTMLGLLALIALVLASVGLYGITAHGVAHRTREIGIRIALGARPSQVVRPFLWRALAYLLVGVALGLAGVYQLAGLIEQLLVRTAANDPVAIVVVIALLTVVAAVATVSPALRAARVDPIVALRRE